jgi:hypothetical protein
LYIAGRGSERRKSTLIHISLVSEEGRVLRLCGDCSQVHSSQEDSQEDCREKLEALTGCRVTATGFPGGQTEGRKWLLKAMDMMERRSISSQEKTEMDKELTEIRARMEELALQMQQDARSHWVYEWPMKTKVKWPVREMLARRQRRLLKMWLRHAESLRDEEGDGSCM